MTKRSRTAEAAEPLLATMPFQTPAPVDDHDMHFCADKAYDSADVHSAIGLLSYQDYNHIKSRGQEHNASKDQPGYRAGGWVFERTHYSLQGFLIKQARIKTIYFCG